LLTLLKLMRRQDHNYSQLESVADIAYINKKNALFTVRPEVGPGQKKLISKRNGFVVNNINSEFCLHQ